MIRKQNEEYCFLDFRIYSTVYEKKRNMRYTYKIFKYNEAYKMFRAKNTFEYFYRIV
jgi:hypothetical protein